MDKVTQSPVEGTEEQPRDAGAGSGPLTEAFTVDAAKVRAHVDEVVRSSVEQTLNSLLDAEADRLCNAGRYEHSPDRQDTRAGSYPRKLTTKAGEVNLQVPRLRKLPLETAIIERYKRRERGLAGVKLFVTDKYLGLIEALAEFYPQAAWQRCVVHFYRNVFTAVPSGKVREVAATPPAPSGAHEGTWT